MKDRKKKRFHIAKKKDIPDLTRRGYAVAIHKGKPKPLSEEGTERRTYVASWNIRSSEAEKGNKRKKEKKIHWRFGKKGKKALRKWIIVTVCTVAVFASYLTVTLQTYTDITVISQRQETETGRRNYQRFGENILCCSQNKVTLSDTEGKELWKEDLQVSNPEIEVNGESAVVADQGGNVLQIYGEKGLKGEIRTELPIERIAVSEKGITAVILKNENTPQIQCYDATGNILLEYKVSALDSGYPMDLALSSDGTMMLVSYLSVKNGTPDTKLVSYDFTNAKEKDNYISGEAEYKDTVMPSVSFVSDEKAVAAGDDGFAVLDGATLKEDHYIKMEKEIKTICYDKEYFAAILKNANQAGYELKLYDYSGKEVISKDVKDDYSKMKIEDGQILMYDTEKCSIYTESGVHRFEGTMGTNISDIFPLKGINKYLVVDANGTRTVRLKK